MSDVDTGMAALLLRLLESIGVVDSSLLASCMSAHRATAGRLASMDTATLTMAFKTLQKRAPADRKAEFDDVFMQLVSKDTGSLVFILVEIGRYFNDKALMTIKPREIITDFSTNDSSLSSPGALSSGARRAPAERLSPPTRHEQMVNITSAESATISLPSTASPPSIPSRTSQKQQADLTSKAVKSVRDAGAGLPLSVQSLLSHAQTADNEVFSTTKVPYDVLRFGHNVILRSQCVASGCLGISFSRKLGREVAHCQSTGVGLEEETFEILAVNKPPNQHNIVHQGDVLVLRHAKSRQYVCLSEASKPAHLKAGDTFGIALANDVSAAVMFVIYAPELLHSTKRQPISSSTRIVLLAGHSSLAGTTDFHQVRRSAIIMQLALQGGHGNSGFESTSVAVAPIAGEKADDSLLFPSSSACWSPLHVTKYTKSSDVSLYCHAYIPAWCVRFTDVASSHRKKIFSKPGDGTKQLPLHVQETVMVDFILATLMGNLEPASRGRSIGYHGAIAIDPTFRSIADQIFPIAECYQAVSVALVEFSKPDAGLVAHSFAAAARQILKEFVSLVLQLQQTARAEARPTDSKGVLRSSHLAVAQRPGYSPLTTAAPATIFSMSLQRLWFYLQPSLRTMTGLSKIAVACQGVKGGHLLSTLSGLIASFGDEVYKTLATFLLERSALPWFKMLDIWLYTGTIEDIFSEFMIVENLEVTAAGLRDDIKNRYWDTRFSLVRDNIPTFLLPHSQVILSAGKYVHVLRLCNNAVVPDGHTIHEQQRSNVIAAAISATPIGSRTRARLHAGLSPLAHMGHTDSGFSAATIHRVARYASRSTYLGLEPDTYASSLHKAASAASQALLDMFVRHRNQGGLSLFSRLSSLKAFFFASRGDYLTHFLDNAEHELIKEVAAQGLIDVKSLVSSTTPASFSSVYRLRHLFELAVRGSTAEADLHKDEITCMLASSSALAQLEAIRTDADDSVSKPQMGGLKGFNAFCLDFNATWPLSIVLSRNAIAKYQLLFRTILFAKFVEKAICQCFVSHQSCKELNMRGTLSLSFALRQRMLHFLQNVIYYMLAEVIEPRWHEMMEKMRIATSVEDIIVSHQQFLDRCLDECLLTSPDMLKLQTKLTMLCFLFSQQISQSIESHRLSEEELDRRAGLNKASKRARAQREKGEYYAEEDDDDDARSTSSKLSTTSYRRRPLGSHVDRGVEKTGNATKERQRRKARLQVQTEAMQHTMAQQGWQAMIVKSSKMFDALLKDFIGALVTKTKTEYDSHLLNLCERLDFNGFYSSQFGIPQT